jgi:hypothetical protein
VSAAAIAPASASPWLFGRWRDLQRGAGATARSCGVGSGARVRALRAKMRASGEG